MSRNVLKGKGGTGKKTQGDLEEFEKVLKDTKFCKVNLLVADHYERVAPLFKCY